MGHKIGEIRQRVLPRLHHIMFLFTQQFWGPVIGVLLCGQPLPLYFLCCQFCPYFVDGEFCK